MGLWGFGFKGLGFRGYGVWGVFGCRVRVKGFWGFRGLGFRGWGGEWYRVLSFFGGFRVYRVWGGLRFGVQAFRVCRLRV